MLVTDLNALPLRELFGCKAHVVHSQCMTFVHWRFEPGQVIAPHAHPHEQVATVIAGDLELTVGEDTRRLGPGCVAVVPPNVAHTARALSACYVIDAFYPVREDYR
ncbi:MAG TPA: cupin domain-containing protein [Planctomycetota bacterium]|nr:cupin domain-containing protein [Planctomycetota bacterium]HRR81993.1 cupin domain-containing protein [Planctomycetota bacterium]HRT94445.1 cupin domain-containing protein [Planctomycetota bacterium]